MGIVRAIKWGVGIWFGGFALLILLVSIFGNRPEPEPQRPLTSEEAAALIAKVKEREEAYWNSEDGRKDAYYMSREFVKKQLKAPATADFPRYTDPAVEAHHRGKGVFLVKGYVDAQNAFGANLRTRYLCELKDNGDKTWTAISVVLP